jgi:ATP-dependent Clp protease ATP-binding subunit ClpX
MSKDIPTPEDVQKKLTEFMKQQFGEKVVLTGIMPQADPGATDAGETSEEEQLRFDFHFKPRDVKDYLDRFVIKQDDAKKAIAIAVCDHYNHVRDVEAHSRESKEKPPDYAKQNVIFLGPTGVGKTYLIRCIAQLIGVPFVKADATKFSETGYVGGDVDDLVRELLQQADGNLKLAQYGIIYIDEIDKIATPSNTMGRDVSGKGVQTNLLKLMEETEVSMRSPNDLTSQLQAAMEFQRKGKVKRDTINTRHILFIVSGAFDRLEEIIRQRLKKSRIGFQVSEARKDIIDSELFRQVTTSDFIKFGFEPEFIGRLPVRVVCDSLTEEDLYQILQKSEGSILRQYERSFRAFGIEVGFKEDGLREIARLAVEERTGARGLMTVCEKIFREFKFQLPSSGVHQFEVTAHLIQNPHETLNKLLELGAREERHVLEAGVAEFCTRFAQRHGLVLKLEPETVQRIVDMAIHEKKNVRDVCARAFKDYEFGLNLVKKNMGSKEFSIPPSALDDPDKFLSQLVVGSYRKDEIEGGPSSESESSK